MSSQRIRIPLLFILLLSACAPAVTGGTPAAPDVPAIPAASAPPVGSLSGWVLDLEGNPLAGAEVFSITGSTLSAADGSFSLPGAGRAGWVQVSLTGYIGRTRAVAPDAPAVFRLSPDDGRTIVIHFVGDTMFGRRFFDPNEDGDPSDGLLSTQPTTAEQVALLTQIEPLLSAADLSVANLESPFTDQPYLSPRDTRPTAYHSSKDYVFSSHPSVVAALRQAGLDVVDIGNNHMYDLLEPGLADTLAGLDQGGLGHFGAGPDEASAWAPYIAQIDGQRVAFIGCTTIWQPVTDVPMDAQAVTYVAQDSVPKGGAAWCEENALRQAVASARRRADAVVVMVHGGFEYGRYPSENVARFSELAREAGAALVVNHHPHVVGGFSWEAPTLTAWSLGNFIFDQTVWPTFESYLLAVYLRDGQVVRAYIEPLMIEGFLPRGLTGAQAEYVLRGAAGRVPGPYVMESGAVEFDLQARALACERTQEVSAAQAVTAPLPDGQWISALEGSGTLTQGRDLLWIGDFESGLVGRGAVEPLLWMPGDGLQYGPEFAYQGQGGIRIQRGSSNVEDALTTHLHRILVSAGSHLTVTGMARPSNGAQVRLQVSWYPDTKGPSTQRPTQVLPLIPGAGWQPFEVDLQVPPGMVAANIFLRLSPPTSGLASLDLDDLALVEWAAADAAFSPLYTHYRFAGDGRLTFRQDLLPGVLTGLMDCR